MKLMPQLPLKMPVQPKPAIQPGVRFNERLLIRQHLHPHQCPQYSQKKIKHLLDLLHVVVKLLQHM